MLFFFPGDLFENMVHVGPTGLGFERACFFASDFLLSRFFFLVPVYFLYYTRSLHSFKLS